MYVTIVCYSPLVHVLGTHGTVRLIDGLIPEEGTVEVCVNAVWSSVCQWRYWYTTDWDYKDAFVVCRQLGYPATGKTLYIKNKTTQNKTTHTQKKKHGEPLNIFVSFLILPACE